jgi:allantoinase
VTHITAEDGVRGGDLFIHDGSVMLPNTDAPVRTDILIRGGTIVAIGESLSDCCDISGTEVIDAAGLLVLPGGVDPHVHFDEPGFTDREDFYHGTSAAASGGITTIVDMPCTSIPPVTSRANFETKYAVISRRAVVDYGLYGGVADESFSEGFPQGMEELAPYVLGFKTYFISVMELFHHVNHYQFRKVLEAGKRLGRPILLHAEDLQVSEAATAAAQQAGNSVRDFVDGRPEDAEILAILNAAELARRAQSDLHIVHVSTARGAEIVAANPYVTGETCPHYLAFDLEDFVRIGSAAKVTPPIKAEPNRTALWDAIIDGGLSYVASDHAPAPTVQKNTGSIWTDYAGIPGTGTLLPFLYSEGYRQGQISLRRLVEITSSAAAARWGIDDRKGALLPGRDGDCVLIDPNGTWSVRGEEFLSKGKVTPFEGKTLLGRISQTIVRGTVVYTDGEGITVDPGYGHHLRPQHADNTGRQPQ